MTENTEQDKDADSAADVGLDGVVMQHVPDEFTVGQKVRHRASGEIGIVVEVCEVCVSHSGLQHLNMQMAYFGPKNKKLDHGECELMPTGRYVLDIGFEKDDITVDGYMLEVSV